MVQVTNEAKRTGKIWKEEPAAKPNYTSIGADLIMTAVKKQEAKTGQLFIVATHGNELGALAIKLKAATSDESIRGICTEYVNATPEGSAYVKRQQELVALGKLKTKKQRSEMEMINTLLSASSILLQRSCDCWLGLKRLIDAECKYQFDRVTGPTGSNVYTLYIWRDLPDQREWLTLNAKQLANAASATFKQDTPPADIRIACNEETQKQGKANEVKAKGNGEALPAKSLSAAFVDIDASLVRYDKDNGTLSAGPNATHQMHMVWARIDAMMTAEQKQKARKAFAAEADKQAKKAADTKRKVEALKKGKKKVA